MLAWNFKTMKEKQLLWATFCVLCLLENQVSGDATNSSILTTTNIPTISTLFINSTVKTTSLTGSLDNDTKTGNETAVYSSPIPKTENETILQRIPIIPTTNVTLINETAETMSGNGTNAPNETTMTQKPTSTPLLTRGHTVKSTYKTSVSLTTAIPDNSSATFNITCVKIKQLTSATNVICLELTEVHLCEHFKINKGVELSKLVCKRNELACLIELAESDVNRHCMLLVAVNNKGADVLSGFLDDKQPDLNVLGIKPHKQEPVEAHQVHSRKTLIALVTTGLLLAFLGLAGYYLMKRRSWSPMGERLGEDPYYTENDSHGNPVISEAPHEQSDLQDKPNLNGGARENGTGQPTSKNGHSARPQVVADTEL